MDRRQVMIAHHSARKATQNKIQQWEQILNEERQKLTDQGNSIEAFINDSTETMDALPEFLVREFTLDIVARRERELESIARKNKERLAKAEMLVLDRQKSISSDPESAESIARPKTGMGILAERLLMEERKAQRRLEQQGSEALKGHRRVAV